MCQLVYKDEKPIWFYWFLQCRVHCSVFDPWMIIAKANAKYYSFSSLWPQQAGFVVCFVAQSACDAVTVDSKIVELFVV